MRVALKTREEMKAEQFDCLKKQGFSLCHDGLWRNGDMTAEATDDPGEDFVSLLSALENQAKTGFMRSQGDISYSSLIIKYRVSN